MTNETYTQEQMEIKEMLDDVNEMIGEVVARNPQDKALWNDAEYALWLDLVEMYGLLNPA